MDGVVQSSPRSTPRRTRRRVSDQRRASASPTLGPRPGAQPRRLPDPGRGPERPDRVGHPRPGLAAGGDLRRSRRRGARAAAAAVLLPSAHRRRPRRPHRLGHADLLGVGDHLADHELRAHAGRRRRHRRVHRRHRRQLRRLLRAPEGRGPPRADDPQLGAAQLQGHVAHDPRRRPRVVPRRHGAVHPQRRVGARLRPLPRHHHGLRRRSSAYFFTRPAVGSARRHRAGSTKATRSA